jgi:GTP-binding protein
MSGVIAIVGRPNVGKSALFNRIAGKRIAIVHDEPGVTRDRISAEVEWKGWTLTLVDTGGIGIVRAEKARDPIAEAAFEQVQTAIDTAHVIMLVVNVQEGLTPLDHEVATRLRASGKPVLLVANKADDQSAEAYIDEFAELGFHPILPASAIHGRGITPIMQATVALLPPTVAGRPADSASPGGFGEGGPAGPLKLAIVGRPNVGKSSLVNALTRSRRVIVSPLPGTTRDAVDVPFEVKTEVGSERYILIDTAGLRKPRRIVDSIEFFSVRRAEESIGRCDIAILVLDAGAGITEQDKKVADRILEAHKACIVVVNKWDLVADEVRRARRELMRRRVRQRSCNSSPLVSLGEFRDWVHNQLFFLDYAPVIFTSALSGLHLGRLLEAVRYVATQLRQKVPTALLNRVLADAIERQQPLSSAGHRLRLFYATQIKQAPPTFLLFVNRKELLSTPYSRYLAKQIRRAFGFEGCPIMFVARPRPRSIEPVRQMKNPIRGVSSKRG